MSEAKHTPGPWEVGVYNTTDRFRNTTQHTCVFKPDDMGLLAVTGPYGDEQSKIDARLIAAAPELLAVAESNLKILKALYDTPTESGVFSGIEYQVLEQAIADTEAAIAAAKGEA